jgi:hypothetical protein
MDKLFANTDIAAIIRHVGIQVVCVASVQERAETINASDN